jgi:hypothetical protein
MKMPLSQKHIPLEEYLYYDQYVPRPFDEEQLAELKALCYDDDLRQAYVILHEQHVWLWFSKHQKEQDMSDAIRRVLRSLNETTLEAQKLRAKLERIRNRVEEKTAELLEAEECAEGTEDAKDSVQTLSSWRV